MSNLYFFKEKKNPSRILNGLLRGEFWLKEDQIFLISKARFIIASEKITE